MHAVVINPLETTLQIPSPLKLLLPTHVPPHRLLHDLSVAQRHLAFWRQRLQAGGSHGLFMLLSRGPVMFVSDVLAALKIKAPNAAASERIEERVRVGHVHCILI